MCCRERERDEGERGERERREKEREIERENEPFISIIICDVCCQSNMTLRSNSYF
jgi:hypothetical protein